MRRLSEKEIEEIVNGPAPTHAVVSRFNGGEKWRVKRRDGKLIGWHLSEQEAQAAADRLNSREMNCK